MKALFASIVAFVGFVVVLGPTGAGDKPKHTIKEVMKEIMKGQQALSKKVFAGEGTKEENKKVLEYFIALHENTPPKGEKGSWDKLTATFVETAKKIDAGEEKGSKKLAASINCGACHKEFKAK